MGLYEQVDYDFSGPLQPQDLFGREYVTMGGVIDHHLTTTVQLSCKMSEKLVVMTNNRLFLVLGRNCAESTKFTFQRQSIPSCRSSPTPGAGGANPFGRTKSSILWVLFFLFFADPRFLCAMPKRSFTVIIRCKCFQQDTFVRTGQFDFSHNPIAFHSFSCALRLFLSNAWA